MKATLSRQYPGHGQVVAVYLGGIRYGLSANGNPDNPALNPRASRRNLLPAKEHASNFAVLPLPLPTCGFDDLEPVHFDFGSEFADRFGAERESLSPADDYFFDFMSGP